MAFAIEAMASTGGDGMSIKEIDSWTFEPIGGRGVPKKICQKKDGLIISRYLENL